MLKEVFKKYRGLDVPLDYKSSRKEEAIGVGLVEEEL